MKQFSVFVVDEDSGLDYHFIDTLEANNEIEAALALVKKLHLIEDEKYFETQHILEEEKVYLNLSDDPVFYYIVQCSDTI